MLRDDLGLAGWFLETGGRSSNFFLGLSCFETKMMEVNRSCCTCFTYVQTWSIQSKSLDRNDVVRLNRSYVCIMYICIVAQLDWSLMAACHYWECGRVHRHHGKGYSDSNDM